MRKLFLLFFLSLSFSLASASSTINIPARSCFSSDGNYVPYQNYNIPCNVSLIQRDDNLTALSSYPNGETGGFLASTFLTGVNNCDKILSVNLCYRWFSQRETIDFECQIFASNGSEWRSASGILNNDCPPTDANTPLACKDVTNLFNWTCRSFFNSNHSSAIKFQAVDTGSENSQMFLDTAYYSVTYQSKPFCVASARKT